VSLRRHNSGFVLWKAAPEEVRLEATVEDSEICADVMCCVKPFPTTASGDRESFIDES